VIPVDLCQVVWWTAAEGVGFQARGPKKHLKRLNAPRHWLLSKMDGIWVSASCHVYRG
jgi:hypothetical protein